MMTLFTVFVLFFTNLKDTEWEEEPDNIKYLITAGTAFLDSLTFIIGGAVL